jgi:plastocyanin
MVSRSSVRGQILMRRTTRIISIAIVVLAVMAVRVGGALAASHAAVHQGPSFLPTGEATKIVTVTNSGEAQGAITVLTEAVAIKETGPKATVKKFGEVYTFSPSFIVVHRDQPTQIEFWNLQPDDEHDFALVGPDSKGLMYITLPPLKKTSFIFTFHEEGVIDFKCLRHQPEMSGQILVLPPVEK